MVEEKKEEKALVTPLVPISDLVASTFIKLTPSIDACLGGGIRQSQQIDISGKPNSGKSSFAIYAAKCAYEQLGMKTVIIDAEMKHSREFLDRFGIDVKNVLITKPDKINHVFGVSLLKAVEAKVKTNEPNFIIVDSVTALATNKGMTEGFDAESPGKLSALTTSFSKHMAPFVAMSNSIIVYINQHRSNFKMGAGPEPAPVGGWGLSHACQTRLRVSEGKCFPDDENPLGHMLKIEILKCPTAKPKYYSKTSMLEVPLWYDRTPDRLAGIDLIGDIIVRSCVLGLIGSGGAWFTIRKFNGISWPPEEFKTQGEFNLIETLRPQHEYLDYLYKECNSIGAAVTQPPEKKKRGKKE